MDFFVGSVCPMAFNYAPRGWMSCEGQLLPIAQYSALFSLLGVAFGGNGTTNFALPDLRGRAVVGSGTMPGGSGYQIGQTGGATAVTLTTNNIPSHSHVVAVNANQITSDSNDPQNNYLGGGVGNNYTATAPDVNMNTNVSRVMPAGSGLPMGVLNPYTVTYYNICISGVFPSRP